MTAEISTSSLSYTLLVFVSALTPFSIHLILVRFCGLFRESAHRQKGPVASCLIGLIPVGVLFYLWSSHSSPREPAWSGIFIFAVYLLAAYVYFHIFNMSETARRIRILTGSPQAGGISKSEIARSYPQQGMVDIRLERLLSLKELRLTGDKYLVDRGILVIPAKLVSFFHDLLFPPKKNG